MDKESVIEGQSVRNKEQVSVQGVDGKAELEGALSFLSTVHLHEW